VTARPILLNGPPGSGKTTLAPQVASRLGYELIDLDALIEREAGSTIPELFAREGEGVFRARERAALKNVLDRERVVVALGGGALVERAFRHEALRRALVVSLDAPPEVLLARLGASSPRPLVTSSPDPEAALRSLLELRRAAYAEAHLRLDTSSDASLDPLVDHIAALCDAPPLVMPLGERTYRLHFEPLAGLTKTLAGLSPSALVTVTDRTVHHHWGEAVRRVLGRKPAASVRLHPGEASKNLGALTKVWEAALAAGVDRNAVFVCVGGGVVTDLGGFAAATLLRGVRYVSVPTTLLGMVDASVGGKTAIDHRRGKNLVGAFHHPSSVWIDTAFLSTLPARERRAGMAEAVKVGVALDAELLDLIESAPADLDAVIRRAVQAKIDVVAVDERESGPRMLLNFGHTIGHAIESASGYRMLHGECVAVGMVAALELGAALGVTPPALVTRVTKVLETLALPTRARVRRALVLRHLTADKKRDQQTLRFVLATEAGRAVVEKVAMEAVEKAVERVVIEAPKRDY
jgi:shikimate kinase/3-dehydroquinate synthase